MFTGGQRDNNIHLHISTSTEHDGSARRGLINNHVSTISTTREKRNTKRTTLVKLLTTDLLSHICSHARLKFSGSDMHGSKRTELESKINFPSSMWSARTSRG